MTDQQILKGIMENSSEAWRCIYMNNCPKIRKALLPLIHSCPEISFDDIFQQGCITLMENVKDGKIKDDGNTNVGGYLYTICLRFAMKELRRVRRDVDKTSEESEDSGKDGSIATLITTQEEDPDTAESEEAYAKDFLDRVLSSMSERCRQLFKLFYWDKFPMDAIAPTMGLRNADSAKATKSKCMSKFKKIANDLLADDEKAEEAVRKTIERSSLRDLLEELRLEEAGVISVAACHNPEEGSDSSAKKN